MCITNYLHTSNLTLKAKAGLACRHLLYGEAVLKHWLASLMESCGNV